MKSLFAKSAFWGVAGGAGFALLIGAGCDVSDPCDPGDTYELGFCVPAPEEMAAPDEGDGDGDGDDTMDSAGGAGAGGAGAVDEPDEPVADPGQLGTPCEKQEDCSGETACAIDFGLPNCIGQCGAGEPFEGMCPDSNPCTDLGGSMICSP